MFPYDLILLKAVQSVPNSVADVLQIMQNIEANCIDGDGLKWFNWLYLQVTAAVESRIAAGGFADPAWLAELDVQFARLYFSALESFLSGGRAPDCWQVLFEGRSQVKVAHLSWQVATTCGDATTGNVPTV